MNVVLVFEEKDTKKTSTLAKKWRKTKAKFIRTKKAREWFEQKKNDTKHTNLFFLTNENIS